MKPEQPEPWYMLSLRAMNRIYWDANKERIMAALHKDRAKRDAECAKSRAYCRCCSKPIEDGAGFVKRGSLFCSRCCATDYHEAMLEDKADARKEQER